MGMKCYNPDFGKTYLIYVLLELKETFRDYILLIPNFIGKKLESWDGEWDFSC